MEQKDIAAVTLEVLLDRYQAERDAWKDANTAMGKADLSGDDKASEAAADREHAITSFIERLKPAIKAAKTRLSEAENSEAGDDAQAAG